MQPVRHLIQWLLLVFFALPGLQTAAAEPDDTAAAARSLPDQTVAEAGNLPHDISVETCSLLQTDFKMLARLSSAGSAALPSDEVPPLSQASTVQSQQNQSAQNLSRNTILKVMGLSQVQTAESNRELAPVGQKTKAIWLLLLALAFESAVCIFLTSFHDSAPADTNKQESPKSPHVIALDGQRTIYIAIMICMHLGAIPESAFLFSGLSSFTLLAGVVRSLQKGQSDFTLSEYRKAFAMIMARFCPVNGMALLLLLLTPGCAFHGASVYWKQALFLQGFELGWDPKTIVGAAPVPIKALGNVPVWYLSILFWLTLLFPLLHNIRPRGCVAYVLIPIALLVYLHYALDKTNPHQPFTHCTMMFCDWCPSGQTLPGRLIEYILGMLIAQLYFEMPEKVRRWSGWGWTFDLAWLAGWVFGLAASYTGGKMLTGAIWRADMMPLELLFLFMLCVYCFVMLASICEDHYQRLEEQGRTRCSGILIRFCEAKPLTFMAQYCLGAYMYHQIWWSFFAQVSLSPTSHVLNNWRYGWMNALPMPWLIPFAFSWITGIISEHVIERPIRMYIGYRILSRSSDPAAQAVLMKHTGSSAGDPNRKVQS